MENLTAIRMKQTAAMEAEAAAVSPMERLRRMVRRFGGQRQEA